MSEGLTHRAAHTLVDEEEPEPSWLREAGEDVGMPSPSNSSNHLNSPTKERNDHALPLPSRSPGSHRQPFFNATSTRWGGHRLLGVLLLFACVAHVAYTLLRFSKSEDAKPQLAKAKVAVDYKVQRQNLLAATGVDVAHLACKPYRVVAGERLKCEITARNAIGESLGELPARLWRARCEAAAVLDPCMRLAADAKLLIRVRWLLHAAGRTSWRAIHGGIPSLL